MHLYFHEVFLESQFYVLKIHLINLCIVKTNELNLVKLTQFKKRAPHQKLKSCRIYEKQNAYLLLFI